MRDRNNVTELMCQMLKPTQPLGKRPNDGVAACLKNFVLYPGADVRH